MADDLDKLAPILEALAKVARDSATYRKSLGEVDQQFKAALSEAVSSQSAAAKHGLTRVFRLRQSVIRALRPPRTSQELIEQIKRTCGLDSRQVRVLEEIRLLTCDASGQPTFRPRKEVILPPEKAACYLYLLGCLTGLAIASILLAGETGVGLIFRGLALGLAIGGVAGFVLGRSFRAYPILDKLDTLRPWLNSGHEITKAG